MKDTVIRSTRYTTYRRNTYTPYPGAAACRRFFNRLLDAALAASITIAVIVILLFLLIL